MGITFGTYGENGLGGLRLSLSGLDLLTAESIWEGKRLLIHRTSGPVRYVEGEELTFVVEPAKEGTTLITRELARHLGGEGPTRRYGHVQKAAQTRKQVLWMRSLPHIRRSRHSLISATWHGEALLIQVKARAYGAGARRPKQPKQELTAPTQPSLPLVDSPAVVLNEVEHLVPRRPTGRLVERVKAAAHAINTLTQELAKEGLLLRVTQDGAGKSASLSIDI